MINFIYFHCFLIFEFALFPLTLTLSPTGRGN